MAFDNGSRFSFCKGFQKEILSEIQSFKNIKSYSPSYKWRSICSARSLVNKGLIKRVDSGASISVWKDLLIPAQFPRLAISNGSIIDPSLKVQHLINSRSNFWNNDLLKELFDPEDVKLISALHLGASTKEDTLGWHFTKSEKYTVKSGYHRARLEILEDNSSFIGHEINVLKAHGWKVQCPPKLRHFLWQTLAMYRYYGNNKPYPFPMSSGETYMGSLKDSYGSRNFFYGFYFYEFGSLILKNTFRI